MKMKCPCCGVNGSVSDTLLGRRVRCPKCKEIFTAMETPAPSRDHGSLPETSGYHQGETPAPGMTAQDEAALEDEIAKIFEDMTRSAPDNVPDSRQERNALQEGSQDTGSPAQEDSAGSSQEDSLNEEELKSGLEDILSEKCSACGAPVGKSTQHDLEGKVYCSACLPSDSGEADELSSGKELAVSDSEAPKTLKGDWEGKAAILAALGILAVILFAAVYIIIM